MYCTICLKPGDCSNSYCGEAKHCLVMAKRERKGSKKKAELLKRAEWCEMQAQPVHMRAAALEKGLI
jgi:hypothetical protein